MRSKNPRSKTQAWTIKKELFHPGLFNIIDYNISLTVIIPRVMVLTPSTCIPSWHQPRSKCSISFLLPTLPSAASTSNHTIYWPPYKFSWGLVLNLSADEKKRCHIVRSLNYGQDLLQGHYLPFSALPILPSGGTQEWPVGMKSVCPCFTEHL